MNAKDLFEKMNFKLIYTNDYEFEYAYETDYDKTLVTFYTLKKAYEVDFFRFDNTDIGNFVPMNERPENIKHSAKYGHWQRYNPQIGCELHNAIHQQLIELGWILEEHQ